MKKMSLEKIIKNETGQVMIMVLILLVVGSLIITPLLAYVSTGLNVGREVYEEKMDSFYAADSGVEDALWQIKYDKLTELFEYDTPAYDPYAYYEYSSSNQWDYYLSEPINGDSVNVTIGNSWIPQITPIPDEDEARLIIEGIDNEPPKLIIVGSVSGTSEYQIKIYYYKEDTDDPLEVESLGIWLPPGFNYDVDGQEEDDFEAYLEANFPGDYSRKITTHNGGEAVVWTFSPAVLFTDLPEVNPQDQPMESIITFQFTGPLGQSPGAVSWIDTNLDLSGGADITYTWDADIKVYKITSTATDTTTDKQTIVEAYTAKCELRKLGSAIGGEYRAAGATLMIDENPWHKPPIRDTLLGASSVEVDDIPVDAEVEKAYLYWSAWLADTGEEILFWDYCTDLDNGNWDYGSDWHESGSSTAFYAHHDGGGRELKMENTLDLHAYEPETVTASWRNWTYRSWPQGSDDCLQYGFYDNGSSSWDWYSDLGICGNIGTSPVNYTVTVPDTYLTSTFKIGFRIQSYSDDNEYIYIDNVKISVQTGTIADTSAIFKIDGDQVYFDEGGVPTKGAEEITASEWSLLENEPGEYSYSCYLDVTQLVRTFSDEGDNGNYPGNATYIVGGVDGDTGNEWSYAAWSLIIIYSSPETHGHQLYLYDDFIYSGMNCNVDFDGDGEEGGTISGFLVPEPIRDPDTGEIIEENAAKLTCFVGEGDDYYNDDYLKFNGTRLSDGKTKWDVWNSWSLGMSEDGIDIDTFYVTWASDLLKPEDTSAQVDLPTETDSWNLVYIILSFRSATTTGGTMTYLVRG